MIRLAVRCRPELAETVLADLAALAPNGVEQDEGPDYVEYAIYGAAGELPELGELRAAAGDGIVEIESTEIPDDWGDRWKDFHQTIDIGGRLRVRPSWEPMPADGALEVVIDPGQAFGTGAHATTRMCLELLLGLADRDDAGGALADLGTGSAVLAIAAAKLGFSPVAGYDHEVAALEAAAANALANGVEIELERINLREALPPLPPTVVANLTARILCEVAARLGDGPAPERLILSGILREEREEVAAAFAEAGFGLADSRLDGDWVALLLERRLVSAR
jgi:ribosomal protein L11 methyltransferase